MKKRIVSLLLCAAMLLTMFPLSIIPTLADSVETVDILINYVYESTGALVERQFKAQVVKDGSFKRSITIPEVKIADKTAYYAPEDSYTVAAVNSEGGTETSIEGLSVTTVDVPSGDSSVKAIKTLELDLQNIAGNVEITVFYVAARASYTVQHWFQKLATDDYELDTSLTTTLEGDINAYTEAVASTAKAGFYCASVQQKEIASDGSTIVNLYYDRYGYTIIFDTNGGYNGPDPYYGKYGTKIDPSLFQTPTRPSYEFLGWAPDPVGVDGMITITGKVTYQAQWKPLVEHPKFTVVVWGQDANDDDYSYLYKYEAYASAGDTISYDPATMDSIYICEGAHTHSADCYNLTCGLAEHEHSIECGLNCTHVHTAACYGGVSVVNPASNASNVITGFSSLPASGSYNGGLQSGYIYEIQCNGLAHGHHYYLYFEGSWYSASSSQIDGSAIVSMSYKAGSHLLPSNRDTLRVYKAKLTSCSHSEHTDACFACGKLAHTHSALGGACYTLICGKTSHVHTSACPKLSDVFKSMTTGSNAGKYVYSHSDSVKVDASGNSVLNVYYDRTEYTITVKDGGTTVKTIKERWGKDVSSYFPIVGTNGKTYNSGERWDPSGSSIYSNVLVTINAMPAESFTLTKDTASYSTYTMNYYGEALAGTSEPIHTYGGKDYTLLFTVKANYNYITKAEDFLNIAGFTQYTCDPAFSGGQADPSDLVMDFYYTRNAHKLFFYSADESVPEQEYDVPYNKELSGYYYDTTDSYPIHPARPDSINPTTGAFMGWYANPDHSGDPFDFSRKMPDENVALYAWWVNGLFKVETFNSEACTAGDYYTYPGYDGYQEDVIMYQPADPPTDPNKPNEVFIGWYYRDTYGNERPFDYTLPITHDYKLYPKFSDKVLVNYTVHYYKEGTTDKLADDKIGSEFIGQTVTEACKIGAQLNLTADPGTYFPITTSHTIELTADGVEYAFYYKQASDVPYTIKYEDYDGVEIHTPTNKTTSYAVVVEQYLPIIGYTPTQYRASIDVSLDGTTEYVFKYASVTASVSYAYDTTGGKIVPATAPDAPEAENYPAGAEVTVKPAPTATGYTFSGWTSATVTPVEGKFTMGDTAVTFTGYWTINSHSITYYVDGQPYNVTTDSNVADYEYGSSITPVNPTKLNYDFDGWYTDAAMTTPWVDPGTMPDSDITLYGHFVEQTASIKITMDGMDSTENAVFIIKGDGLGDGLRVVVNGNGGETVISGFPLGVEYTIEMETEWTPAYDQKDGKASQKITPTVKDQVYDAAFENVEKGTSSWLTSEIAKKNVFGKNS